MAIANLDNRSNEAVLLINQNEEVAISAGTGITGGTGTVYHGNARNDGTNFITEIYVDLTGLTVAATDLDIIGDEDAASCHLGQITAARSGTVDGGFIQCVEAPLGASADIDLYSAVESTGTEDAGIAALTETALHTHGTIWTVGLVRPLALFPAADEYLYMTNGAAANAGTYTAGRFRFVLYGS